MILFIIHWAFAIVCALINCRCYAEFLGGTVTETHITFQSHVSYFIFAYPILTILWLSYEFLRSFLESMKIHKEVIEMENEIREKSIKFYEKNNE